MIRIAATGIVAALFAAAVAAREAAGR